MQRRGFIFIYFSYGRVVSSERDESNAEKRKRSMEFRWWQALLCAKELFVPLNHSLCLSLSCSYRSQLRFGAVFCSVELGRMWTPPQALRKCPPFFTIITMMPLSVSRTVKTVTACVIRTGWPFQKAFQWKCFFNGVPAGTLLIMCMNCSILSLPTKATPNVIGQNATSIFFNCK